MPSPQTAPFNRRVRILVEVVDSDDEVVLAKEVIAAEGWAVREATAPEAEPIGPRRRGMVVEVRMHGARRGARAAAETQLTRVAERAKLALWVRQAVLLEPPRQPRAAYEVRLRPPAEGNLVARWTLRAARRLSGAHGQHGLSRPGRPDRSAALEELTNSPLGGGHPFNGDVEFLHGPDDVGGDAPDTAENTRPESAAADNYLAFCVAVAFYVGSAAACMVCGAVIQRWGSPWRWIMLVPVALLSVQLGSLLVRQSSSRFARLATGAAGSVASLGMGYLLLATVPVGDSDVLLAVPLLFLGVGVTTWVFYWSWKAAAHSWFSRNVYWLVPVLVVAVPLVLTWFGKALFTVYLDYVFGVPFAAVPVPQHALLYVAIKPVSVATGFALLFLAVAGWARHNYVGGLSGSAMPSLVLPLLTFQYVITALVIGVLGAGAAAYDAAEAARHGKPPPGYYGLDPELMCVQPLVEELSVYNGPLATDRPVLTFGSTGGRIWLWGPQGSSAGAERWGAASVRLEEVSLTSPGPSGGC